MVAQRNRLLMVNPYQPTASVQLGLDAKEPIHARFELRTSMIRFAESKFLLYRCGGRLTASSSFFLFVPREADFEGLEYRDFANAIRDRQRACSRNAFLRQQQTGEPGDRDIAEKQ